MFWVRHYCSKLTRLIMRIKGSLIKGTAIVVIVVVIVVVVISLLLVVMIVRRFEKIMVIMMRLKMIMIKLKQTNYQPKTITT